MASSSREIAARLLRSRLPHISFSSSVRITAEAPCSGRRLGGGERGRREDYGSLLLLPYADTSAASASPLSGKESLRSPAYDPALGGSISPFKHSKTLHGFSNLKSASGYTLSLPSRAASAPAAGGTEGRYHHEHRKGESLTIRRHQHSDEWLVQRAIADRKRRQAKQRVSPGRPSSTAEEVVEDGRNISVLDSSLSDRQKENSLPISSEEQEKIAVVLGRPDLIITRNVEWANLALGFEQQNKYVIMDPCEPQAPVGYILEDSNVLFRQLLRTRRPFVAQVLDAYGNEICSVRRPIWLINSTIYVEVNGKVIGEAHRRWHLWRRVYDCYLGTKQFAAVENPGFWHWTFTLHDKHQGVLAVIDRNWRGFGFEFLTDAGQYVVRFGDSLPHSDDSTSKLRSPSMRSTGGPILAGGAPTAGFEMQNLRAAAEEAEGLDVARPLSLSERAVTLALAVSLDNDYFSQHSSGFGSIPLPFFGGSEAADNVDDAEGSSQSAPSSGNVDDAEGSSQSAPSSPASSPEEGDILTETEFQDGDATSGVGGIFDDFFDGDVFDD